MAEAPDDLVPRVLREMHGILVEHTRQFRLLHKAIEDWKETTAAGMGFAAHANIRADRLEREIAELNKHMDCIDSTH